MTDQHLCWIHGHPIGWLEYDNEHLDDGFVVCHGKYTFTCQTCRKKLWEAEKCKVLLPPVTEKMKEDAQFEVLQACVDDMNEIERTMKEEAAIIEQRLIYHLGGKQPPQHPLGMIQNPHGFCIILFVAADRPRHA